MFPDQFTPVATGVAVINRTAPVGVRMTGVTGIMLVGGMGTVTVDVAPGDGSVLFGRFPAVGRTVCVNDGSRRAG